MTQLVMFDCDGTLVDSQYVIIDSMQAAFRAHGVAPPAPEAVKRIVGLSLPQAIGQLHGDADVTTIESLVAAYKECFLELRASPNLHEPLFADVVETLTLLEETGYVLGIATGKSRRGLSAILETHGLARHFATLQTADDAPSKPHPGMLERAMAETGMDKDETVLIGDTVYDIEMALNAGASAFGVAWGYHDVVELKAAGADLVLDQLVDLPPVLKQRRRKV
ncbi:MAG: HAD-IA family hydrolase [Proteobacteria bacterium]|nr:HAD-IA family hydrolase [Pseudomonadota bacterium]MDA1355066.1 HAD-IA family hydrolase [Pseudomonadota bacterium]